jgi:hypothetical protein
MTLPSVFAQGVDAFTDRNLRNLWIFLSPFLCVHPRLFCKQFFVEIGGVVPGKLVFDGCSGGGTQAVPMGRVLEKGRNPVCQLGWVAGGIEQESVSAVRDQFSISRDLRGNDR